MTSAGAGLLFELWRDPRDGSVEMAEVSADADALRRRISPDAVLLHSYTAVSDFDAFRESHDWRGLGPWRPEPDWTERLFTADEQRAQQAYLSRRVVS